MTDDGPGIPPEVLGKIFEPHITSKKAGHGFGLWTCHRIIQSHKGNITASNLLSGGACFEIVLPVAPDTNE
jgi:two-component system sensor histidine kinase FlrB